MSTIAISRPTVRPVRIAQPGALAQPALRLTRRGKVVVLAVALAAIAVLAIAFGSAGIASGETGAPQDTTTVRVIAGHTLWQIAAEANPTGDIRTTVDQILRLNSLPSASALQLGSEIAVPIY